MSEVERKTCKKGLHPYENMKSYKGKKYCSPCKVATAEKYKATHKEQRRITAQKCKLKITYGITNEVHQQMLKKQKGKCAICKKVETVINNHHTAIRALGVDHAHSCCPGKTSCGKCVRGLLCSKCNKGIGLLNDDIKILRQAIRYIRGTTNEARNRN